MKTVIALLLLVSTVQASGVCLPDRGGIDMERLCLAQALPECRILEAKGDCFWYEIPGEKRCLLAEGAPSHMEQLCHRQDSVGCLIFEEDGLCVWQEIDESEGDE